MRLLLGALLLCCALAQEETCDLVKCGGCPDDNPTICSYCPQFASFYQGDCQATQRGASISGATFRMEMLNSYTGASKNDITNELATYITAPPSMIARNDTRNQEDFYVLNVSQVIDDKKHIYFIAFPRTDVAETELQLATIIDNLDLTNWRSDVLGSQFAANATFVESVPKTRIFCTAASAPEDLSTGVYQEEECTALILPEVEIPWHKTGGLPAVAILFLTIIVSLWFWCSWRNRNARWDAMDAAAAEKYLDDHPEEQGWEEYDAQWQEKFPHPVEPEVDEII